MQKLKVTTDGPITVSIAQEDKRCMARDSAYDYTFCRMILMKVGNAETPGCEVTYIAGTKGRKRDLHLEIDHLEAGEYYVFVEFDWANVTPDGDCEFVITTYGEAISEFEGEEDAYLESENGKINILKDVFRSKAFQDRDTVKIQDLNQYKVDVKRYSDLSGEDGYLFFVLKNEDDHMAYTENCTFTKFIGATLLSPYSDDSFSVKVLPQNDEVILVKIGQAGY